MIATATRRKCKHPGCITRLADANKSDRCYAHQGRMFVPVLDVAERHERHPGHRETLKQYRRVG